MSEFEIKASLRAIKLWLVSISNDDNMPEKDRWLAKQTLNKINELRI